MNNNQISFKKNKVYNFFLFLLMSQCFLLSSCELWNFFPTNNTPKIKPLTQINHTIFINGIPVLEYSRNTPEIKPLLIIQHGLTSKKEDVKDMATFFAENGFFVVTPDAANHGEQAGGDRLSTFELVVNTANAFNSVIQHYENNETVDTTKLVIVGFSLGGLATFYHTANGTYTPTAIVAYCATPDFITMINQNAAYLYYNGQPSNDSFVSANENQISQINTYITEKNPYNSLLEINNVQMCLIVGGEDDVVPPTGAETFYNAHTNKDISVKLKKYDDMGHYFTDDGLLYMVDFISELNLINTDY